MNCLRHIIFLLICICNFSFALYADDCQEGMIFYEGEWSAALINLCVPYEFSLSQQSTVQAFYRFYTVTINNSPIANTDWIAAYKDGICVGAYLWDPGYCLNGVCLVPVMGYDGSSWTEGYMQTGEFPDFKIYDTSENEYYDAQSSEDVAWGNMVFPQINSLEVNLTLQACTDSNACNYDPSASEDDGSCEYEPNCELSINDRIKQTTYSIHNIYPNPFNPITNIQYSLPENANIKLIIYNIQGREIQTLINDFQTAGYHSIKWDGSNYPSGVYLIRLESDNFSLLSSSGDTDSRQRNAQTQKIVLIK